MNRFRMSTPVWALCSFVSCLASAAQLSDDEVKAGWKALFDGSSFKGWRSLGKADFPAQGWDVVDGCMHHQPKGGGGDITYSDAFENFEFVFEWKVSPGANSGVKYRVADKPGSAFGPEYQVIDDTQHTDAKNAKRTAAALYDVIVPAKEKVLKPVGEFNVSKIVVQGQRIEHWLNGVKVVEVEVGSAAWKEGIAASKFSKRPEFGTLAKGQICIQDHGDEVWYRNLKIRELPAK